MGKLIKEVINLKLEKCNNDAGMTEYRCSLTKELDILSGLSKKEHYDMFYHYILNGEEFKRKKCLAIRVPGCTVGSIHYDDNNIITDITIDTGYVIETYPDNVNELVKEFIGEKIEWQ